MERNDASVFDEIDVLELGFFKICKTKIIFVRELFFNLKIKLRLIFLWLSRLLFIILILNRFYR